MKIMRRTFEVSKYPEGSPERATLNRDSITSEYITSYRYELRHDDGTSANFAYRTKREAESALPPGLL